MCGAFDTAFAKLLWPLVIKHAVLTIVTITLCQHLLSLSSV